MKDQPINYPYLSGQLEGAVHNLYNKLCAEGIIDNDFEIDDRALYLIHEVVNAAKAAERKYTTGH